MDVRVDNIFSGFRISSQDMCKMEKSMTQIRKSESNAKRTNAFQGD